MIGRRATGTETHQAEDVDRGRRGVRPAAPIVWGLAAAALFGASTPIAKTLLATLSPWTLAGLLYVGAAAAVLPFAFRGGSPTRRRDAANLRRLAGAVLFGGVLGPVALLQGLTRAPAASVALWLNLETAATALFAWLVFREHLGRRGALANLAVVIAGAMLVGPAGADLTAAGWVGLAALCWGLDNNLTALIDGYTPAQSTLAKGVAAGGCNLVIAGIVGEPAPDPAGLAGGLALGGAAYGLSLLLYVRAAQQLGAARSQMVFATAPFVGVVVAWTLFGEPVRALQVAAAALMAAALWVLLRDAHGHLHVHEPVRHTHRHRHDDGHHDHAHPGLPPGAWHTHEHIHGRREHAHPHAPDLHHRHEHD